MKVRHAALVAILALGVSGCMEIEQPSAGPKQGRYQGKTDTQPWSNDPLAVGAGNGKWTKGDRLSWETQIKARNDGQNEYKRIAQ
jgi:hypothetical protein